MTALDPARWWFGTVSPAGPRARLQVFIFHRVLPVPDELAPDEMHAERFDAVCRWLARWFQVLPLSQAVARLKNGTLPARAAAITFDDGYADNCTVAMPILQRHGLSASFFVATGFLNGGRMWNDTVIEAIRSTRADGLDIATVLATPGHPRLNLQTTADRRTAIHSAIMAVKYLPLAERLKAVDRLATGLGARLPTDLMMTDAQVQALHRGGMEIGAHTVHHPILATMDKDAIRRELADSRSYLEARLQTTVSTLAYPNGKPGEDYGPEAVEVARSLGFAAAVSTVPAMANAASDPLQIPRFTPWDRARGRFALRLALQYRQRPPASGREAGAALAQANTQ